MSSFWKRESTKKVGALAIGGALLVLGFVVFIFLTSRGGVFADSDVFRARRAIFPESWDEVEELSPAEEAAWGDFGISRAYTYKGKGGVERRRGVVTADSATRCLFWQNEFGKEPAIVAAMGRRETQWPFFQPIHLGTPPFSTEKGICSLSVPL